MPDKRLNVVSFGDLVLDLVLPIAELPVCAGEDQLVEQIQYEPGGAGNFLIAGQRIGMEMIALAAVGEDLFGKAVLEVLSTEGVDVSPVICQAEGSTTTVLVLVDRAGQHVFLGQFGSGAEIPLKPDWQMRLGSADAVHLWGYTLQEHRLSQAMLDIAEYAHRSDIPVMFDPGPQISGAPPAAVAQLLACSSVVLLTESELAALSGGLTGQPGAQYLLQKGPHVVVVKSGMQGCTLFTAQRQVYQPGFAVEVLDTTGAGDTFAAAFTYGYLKRWPYEAVLQFANAMGAAKVQKVGSGRQVPTRDEVRQVIQRFNLKLNFEEG